MSEVTGAKRACAAIAVPPRSRPSVYPEPFRSRMAGREKRALGDYFGLKNFGVNLTRLAPGAQSALMHVHTRQDEFIYVLQGEPTLATPEGETRLVPGMCAGFPANGAAHHLINRTDQEVIYLEVGDRTPGDSASYPNDDLLAVYGEHGWGFTRKDGSRFDATT